MREKRIILLITVFFLSLHNFSSISLGGLNEDLLDSTKNGDAAKVKALLDKGTDVNAKDTNGFTALIWAAFMGHINVIELLLDKGANVNAKTTKKELLYNPPGFTNIPAGSTALMVADGDTNVIKVLLNRGADVNVTCDDGSTALIMAAFSGHADVVKLLLDKGANVNAKNNYGTTALKIAGKRVEIVNLLKKAGAKE